MYAAVLKANLCAHTRLPRAIHDMRGEPSRRSAAVAMLSAQPVVRRPGRVQSHAQGPILQPRSRMLSSSRLRGHCSRMRRMLRCLACCPKRMARDPPPSLGLNCPARSKRPLSCSPQFPGIPKPKKRSAGALGGLQGIPERRGRFDGKSPRSGRLPDRCIPHRAAGYCRTRRRFCGPWQ